MSLLPSLPPCGDDTRGGVLGYPFEQLNEEVAFLAYHFHWSLEDILNLEHRDRQGWVERISHLRSLRSSPSQVTSYAESDYSQRAR